MPKKAPLLLVDMLLHPEELLSPPETPSSEEQENYWAYQMD